MDVMKALESVEKMSSKTEGFKEIISDSGITDKEARGYWKNLFGEMEKKEAAQKEEAHEKDLIDTVNEYFEDLKEKSEFKETMANHSFDISDLRKITPEENKEMKEEYIKNRNKLIKEWETIYGKEWPTYKEDLHITTKSGERVCIRKKGQPYDAHHIQPLGMGGKNEARNITPMSADVHYDHRGIHASDSPYSKMDKILGGV